MIHWEPNSLDASLKKDEFNTAYELIDTLSAPDLRSFSIVFKLLIPPPTTSGTKHSFEISFIIE